MSEVEHAHHAEDQREAARQHEQQHTVDETIQQRDQTDLHGVIPRSLPGAKRGSNPDAGASPPSQYP
jgi:hypothetical protein